METGMLLECSYYRCYQVCSNKQGETKFISTKEDNRSKESKDPDYDEEKRSVRRETRRGNRRNYKPSFLIIIFFSSNIERKIKKVIIWFASFFQVKIQYGE